jgi:hypothetical protein
MPLGFLCLCALAFHLAAPALHDLVGLVLLGCHRLFAALGGLVGGNLDNVLILPAREAATPVIATVWAVAVAIRLSLGAWPLDEPDDAMGYVVPGSGFWARLWSIVGRRLHQAKQAVTHLAAYIRDINLEKIYLPLCLPVLLAVAGVSMHLAIENLLFELPARFEGLRDHTGWIPWAAGCTALAVTLVLGFPMVANTVVRIHQRSVRLREKKAGQLRRRIRGILGIVFILLPVSWASLHLLAGGP